MAGATTNTFSAFLIARTADLSGISFLRMPALIGGLVGRLLAVDHFLELLGSFPLRAVESIGFHCSTPIRSRDISTSSSVFLGPVILTHHALPPYRQQLRIVLNECLDLLGILMRQDITMPTSAPRRPTRGGLPSKSPPPALFRGRFHCRSSASLLLFGRSARLVVLFENVR